METKNGNQPSRAEKIASGITLGCCIAGVFCFAFCLICTLCEVRYPDPTLRFQSVNVFTRIGASLPLDGAGFFTLDGWASVPLLVLYIATRLSSRIRGKLLFASCCVVSFAPGVWSHFYYMPLHGPVFLDQPLIWIVLNCEVLILGVVAAIALAVFIRLFERRKPKLNATEG